MAYLDYYCFFKMEDGMLSLGTMITKQKDENVYDCFDTITLKKTDYIEYLIQFLNGII